MILIFKDFVKCGKLSAFPTAFIALISVLLGLFHRNLGPETAVSIKNGLYYTGSFGLLLSAAFFVQKNGNRPLDFQYEWRQHFKRFSLGFVVLFVSLFTCLWGVLIQLVYELL